jgi:ABC-type multidrug transport system fused ATPase/permease subunit
MFSGTIKDNITAGRTELSSDAIDRAAYLSCSDEIISGKTEGLDYKVSAEGSGLSGGQKQRIGIARTLVSKPGLIVLDDSTSALDSGTEKRLLDRLDSLEGDPTIVLISQKIRTLKSCDRIMLVDDGRIVAFAGHDELLESSEEYRSLCQLQGEDAS